MYTTIAYPEAKNLQHQLPFSYVYVILVFPLIETLCKGSDKKCMLSAEAHQDVKV